MLYKTNDGQCTHADAVPHVDTVPSRRQAEAAFARIASVVEPNETMDEDIAVVLDFLRCR